MMGLIHGVTAGQVLVPLLVDANGSPLVFSQAEGYFSGTYVKQPLIPGYLGKVQGQVLVGAAPAGTNVLAAPAVPANRAWVITNAHLQDATSAPTSLALDVGVGITNVKFYNNYGSLVAGQYYGWTGWVLITAGDFLRGIIRGVTLNDSLDFQWYGYYFDTNL
jgi:hypothetical protein